MDRVDVRAEARTLQDMGFIAARAAWIDFKKRVNVVPGLKPCHHTDEDLSVGTPALGYYPFLPMGGTACVHETSK